MGKLKFIYGESGDWNTKMSALLTKNKSNNDIHIYESCPTLLFILGEAVCAHSKILHHQKSILFMD